MCLKQKQLKMNDFFRSLISNTGSGGRWFESTRPDHPFQSLERQALRLFCGAGNRLLWESKAEDGPGTRLGWGLERRLQLMAQYSDDGHSQRFAPRFPGLLDRFNHTHSVILNRKFNLTVIEFPLDE